MRRQWPKGGGYIVVQKGDHGVSAAVAGKHSVQYSFKGLELDADRWERGRASSKRGWWVSPRRE